MTVGILEDAAEDLETGAQFYESCATGVGNNFLDSILSDLDSLVLFAGIHPIYFQFHRMLSKRFPFDISYEVEDDLVYVDAIWICAARSSLGLETIGGEKIEEAFRSQLVSSIPVTIPTAQVRPMKYRWPRLRTA